jgi:16S rRNA G966 N2-methylase RsmD
MRRVAKKVVELVRENGLLRLPRIIAYGLTEVFYERRLGIRTLDYLDRDELGLSNAKKSFYAPTPYREFRRAMGFLSIREGVDVFLDYGSGMGRVVTMAAMHPFRRVIGVEISERLNRIAEENIRRVRKKLKCKDIELITIDATQFEVPPDVTVIYLYNPFRGVHLQRVFENIQCSLQRSPRELSLVFKNPIYFEELADRFPWLVPCHEFLCLTRHRCVIYKSKL